MSSRTLYEMNRRNLDLRKERIAEILPSYFAQEYPNLVSFLKTYYEALDQTGELIDVLEYQLFGLRDVNEIDLKYMDRLYYEIANGASKDYFTDPRFAAKIFPYIIQNKGNAFSTQLFFRLFFNEEPEVSYPKENLFLVFSGDSDRLGESIIGTESLRYLQNGEKYQILSIFIKSGLDYSKWADLYKKFVHPTGFYLSSEVGTETVGAFDPEIETLYNDILAVISFEETAAFDLGASYSETTLLTDSAGTTFVSSAVKTISRFVNIPINSMDDTYDNIQQASWNTSFTMDDSSTNSSLHLSATYETMDADKYDSSY